MNDKNRKVATKKGPKQQGLAIFFPSSSTSARLLDNGNDSIQKKPNKSSFEKKRPYSVIAHNVSGCTDEVETYRQRRLRCGVDGSRFGCCPLCNMNFHIHVLESHAANCNGIVVNPPAVDTMQNTEKEEYSHLNLHSQSTTSHSVHNTSCSRKHDEEIGVKDETNVTSVVKKSWDKYFAIGSNPDFGTSRSDKATTVFNPPKDVIRCTSQPLPGLYHFEEFITEAEENMIVAELDGMSKDYKDEFIPWKLGTFNGPSLNKRWGVHCNLRDRKVSAPERPLPHFIREVLIPRLKQIAVGPPTIAIMKNGSWMPNEANAIDYRRKNGHRLHNHVDDRQLSKEPIANLSLVGNCYMTFKNVRPNDTGNVKEKKVILKRRCLQLLTGKSRYDFSHGIENKDILSDRRISVTMRMSPLTDRR